MSLRLTRTLKLEMRGNDVRQLQIALIELGYNPGNPDGIFGPRTQSTVMAFQQNNGLVRDGIVGPATIAALNRTLTEPAFLKVGSRGPEVATLQSILKELGYDPGMDDGVFGPKTREAVIAFQRNYGLTQDGIAGPQTFTALDQVIRRKTT
ncbi:MULTISPECIES: peptidoglycan-binding protein [Dehalobacter]|uniref:Peptidoglycan-binding protein n=1 Tax=Dehalobacter restrictus (strain DSM 9455 / PER-K23) TaxID=871738 RepID=A0ABM5P7I5_DEHRP|nr:MULTISPECIES: peptidoglycan-binding protein [Dehalobacter]AHF10560.1 peptidoglycan-binding protein [Dehalobacter restrictus DSM 9455]